MSSRMRIDERNVGDITVLHLAGRLELEEGDVVLRDKVNDLVAKGRVKIILDLKDVTRIDSAGIGMLVSKYLSARRRDGTIKLVHLTRHSDHLLDITRLATIFEIYEDEDAALASFEAAGTTKQDAGLG